MGSLPRHHELTDRVLALAKARNRNIELWRNKGKAERLRLEINSKPYLVFFPGSTLEFTPGRVAQLVKRWPMIRNKPAAGYIILAAHAGLSATTVATDGRNLPPRVAVVGLWGTKDRFVASEVDPGMALILEAANVPRSEIRRFLKRKGDGVPVLRASTEKAGALSEAQWRTSPRRGMLLDAYRLERRLGRGHSAEVWKAQIVRRVPGVDLATGTTVAIKIYLPALLHGFESLRIQREFTFAADLEHANLATVFDLLLSPSRPFHTFIVMEYIEGPTLKDFITQHGALSASDTISIARQLFARLQNYIRSVRSIGT